MTQAYRRAQRLIQGLARPELAKLQAQIGKQLTALTRAEAKAQARTVKAAVRGSAKEPPGHIEEKWITNRGKPYGPYRYRRWWDGSVLRSEYLGKAAETKEKAKRKKDH